jgi:hypothetical protein
MNSGSQVLILEQNNKNYPVSKTCKSLSNTIKMQGFEYASHQTKIYGPINSRRIETSQFRHLHFSKLLFSFKPP